MKRQCGECQLCCRLLPIPALNKAATTKCQFQKYKKGCTVHGTAQPEACAMWFCRWLLNDDAQQLARPDRSHYVIDMVPDEMSITNDETGETKKYLAIQVWLDPNHSEAWKEDSEFLDWVERKAKDGTPTLLRIGSRIAMGLLAPSITGAGWLLKGGTINETMGLWK